MIDKIISSKYTVIILIILGFSVRMYGFMNPLADWHSWRQVDTSSVSRNFVQNGFDLLHPTYHDLSNVPSGKDNPQGYRFVEFPIYNTLQAGGYIVFGIFTLEQWGRLVTILASLIGGWFLYAFIRKYTDKTTAFFVLFFYLFLPFSIYYSRTVLPDPSMVTATLGGIYFFDKWLEKYTKSKSVKYTHLYYILAILLTAVALLLKPFAAFFLLPIVYLSYQQFGLAMMRKWELYVFAIFSVLPLGFWRIWMMQFPEGIPANTWLLNGNGIRFRPAFFRWMLYERLTKLLLGYFSLAIFLLGIYRLRTIKHAGLFLSFAISSIVYVTIIATGNVQHDYYQIPIIPSVALFLGLGSAYFLTSKAFVLQRNIRMSILLICIVSALFFSWNQVKDYYNINNRTMVAVGKIVSEKTPKDAKVIALYGGDTTFLYHTKRSGWTSYQDSLPILIEKGADYLVQLDPTEEDRSSFKEQYEIVASSPEYILIKLQ